MNILRNRLIELRKEKNLTQKELATKIGVSASAIGFWETGVNEPKATYLFALAKFFNVSSDFLLGLEDDFGAKTILPINYSPQEREIIKKFRALPANSKKLVLKMLDIHDDPEILSKHEDLN